MKVIFDAYLLLPFAKRVQNSGLLLATLQYLICKVHTSETTAVNNLQLTQKLQTLHLVMSSDIS